MYDVLYLLQHLPLQRLNAGVNSHSIYIIYLLVYLMELKVIAGRNTLVNI